MIWILWGVKIDEPTTQSHKLQRIKKNFNMDSSFRMTDNAYPFIKITSSGYF